MKLDFRYANLGAQFSADASGNLVPGTGLVSWLMSRQLFIFTLFGGLVAVSSANSVSHDPSSGGLFTDDTNTLAHERFVAAVRGTTADDEFNTNTGKIGANVTLEELAYKVEVRDGNGQPIIVNNDEVWALLVVDSLGSPTARTVYFFTGKWGAATMTPATLNQDVKLGFPKWLALSNAPSTVFRTPVLDNLEGAALTNNAVGSAQLNENWEVDNFTIANGSTTELTLSHSIPAKWAKKATVWVGGAVADYGNGSTNLDYQISGATVTFGAALDNGAKVKVKYGWEV